MSGRTIQDGFSGRRIRPGVVLFAMLAAAALAFGVGTALGAFQANDERGTGDPQAAAQGHPTHFNTNRQEIGRGDSVLGRYILYTSTGPEGTCVEIELPETTPPGVRDIPQDCSQAGDPPVNSATLVDEHGSVVYGLVPEGTASVELDRAAGPDLAATLRRGQRGEDKKFFVASSSERDLQATIRAVGPDGQEIAARPVP
jgi:hypothetical protein